MKSNLISKSETDDLLKQVSTQWKIQIPKAKNLMIYRIMENVQMGTAKEIMILQIEETYRPGLSQLSLLEKCPHVLVDMGAVKFMCNGANVMRPGITSYSEFDKEQVVCVIEESQHKFLAVGKSLVPSSELETMEKGEVIKTCITFLTSIGRLEKLLQTKG